MIFVTPPAAFHTKLAEFAGFFIPLNIFLLLLEYFSGLSSYLPSFLSPSLSHLLVNCLFVVSFLLRWKTLQGGPTFFRGLHKGITKFGHGVATIVNTVLLFFVYLLGVGIPAIIAKLFRKRFLALHPSPPATTYYQEKQTSSTQEDYYRQF